MSKNKKMLIYLFFVFVCVNSEYSGFNSNPCSDQNHIFLAPGVLAAGASNRLCVSRFYTNGSAKLNVRLVTEDGNNTTVGREFEPGDGGCIDLIAPSLPNTKAEIIVTVRYPHHQCQWERRATLHVASGGMVIIHTEKARYRPGELVRARLFHLRSDLTPAQGAIDEIWLEGPQSWEGYRMAQWRRVRTKLGVTQIQHQLEDYAVEGKWTIRARLSDGTRGVAAFQVGHYELPPFQLTVRHAERVLRTSDRLVWTVCVRYPWTEAVEGMLVIRIRGVGAPNDSSSGIRTAVRLRAPKACHRHAAAAKRIGLDGVNSPDVVVADFSFQEEGTRIWQNTTVVSQVVDKAVVIEFLTKFRAVISPGLPYKLKIKASRFDGKPAPNEHIRVCRSPTNENGDGTSRERCDEGITDSGGVARITFKADEGGSFYKFQGYLKSDNTTTTAPLILPVNTKGSLHAALGPLKVESLNVRTLVPLYLSAKSVSQAVTVHFVVVTRGGIIYRWGVTTQCPIRNSGEPIQTKSRNSPCYNIPDYGFNYLSKENSLTDDEKRSKRETVRKSRKPRRNESLNLNESKAVTESPKVNETLDLDPLDYNIESQMLRIMLPLKVTHQMCPESHLIVYFYLNGEFVSASKHFEMDECFGDKVQATWLNKQVSPSSPATLHLLPPSPSLCALSVSRDAPPNIQDNIVTQLNSIMYVNHNLTMYDAMGDCFKTEDTPSIPTTALDLTTSWLASSGIRLIGPDVKNPTCVPPQMMMIEDVNVPRTDFSEAWLWRLVAVGSNGTVDVVAKAPDAITRYEATAVCVSKSGIDFSPPAVLQVFRDFFIHTDGAKRLRRGDTTIIKYRLFNYLYEPLSVQIQILTDPHLEGPTDTVEMACISARSSIARRVEILATLVGKGRVSVHAKSVKDGRCVNATMSSSDVEDEVILEVDVEPEGILVQDQKSIMLCAEGTSEPSSNEVTWTFPPVPAVPDTEVLRVWASGDITGPLLADADDLVLLPRGCGEQNLARMATNLLAFNQLDPKAPAYITAKEHIMRGYTRQLQYSHPSGGFSAFGSQSDAASTWLTAFTVRYLKKAHQILFPERPLHSAIQRAEQWLFAQQMESGCFRNEGQVFHRELKGGLNEEGELASIGLTAYVITSLLDSTPIPSRIIKNTLHCLRALPQMKRKNPARVYVLSLLSYAFMKLRSYEEELVKLNEASAINSGKLQKQVAFLERDENMRHLHDLLRIAKKSEGFVWWETGSLSTSIEATSYALLALSLWGAAGEGEGRGALHWLSTHRNPQGGFVSTQDTLIALEALTSWHDKHPGTPANLTAVISSSTTKVIKLWTGMRVPEVVQLWDDRKVHVKVEGTGCAIFQATRSYNSLKPEERGKILTVQVTVNTEGEVDCDANGNNCFCAAVIQACVLWTRGFPEMALLEIALPGGYEADPSLLYEQLQRNDSLLRRIELTPTNTRATLYLASKDGSKLARSGHKCYKIHSLGPKSKTKPAYAKVMDYYKPVFNDTQIFTISEECPPKILPRTDIFSNTDNLFISPKLLHEDEEGVGSNEFAFDDMPDGIPFEDPMYDNLTDKTKAEINKKSDTVLNNKIDDKIELLDQIKAPNKIFPSIIEEPKQITIVRDKITIVGDIKTTPLPENDINIPKKAKDAETGTEVELENDKRSGVSKHSNYLIRKESELKQNVTNISEVRNVVSNTAISKTVPSKRRNSTNNDSNSDKNKYILPKLRQAKNKNTSDDNKSITFIIPAKPQFKTALPTRRFLGNDDSVEPALSFKSLFTESQQPVDNPEENSQKTSFSNENPLRFGKEISDSVSTESEADKTINFNNDNERNNTGESLTQVDAKPEEPVVSDSRIEENKEELTTQSPVDNPNLSQFHVIDSNVDLAVPEGVEGPIPSVMLPPPQMNNNNMMNGRNNGVPVPYPGYQNNYWNRPGQNQRMYQQPPYMDYTQEYLRNYWRYYQQGQNNNYNN